MKKLMALIVIIMIATSYILVAEAVENPFKFSLYNQIKLKSQDESQLGRMPDAESLIADSSTNDFNVVKAVINDEMKCSASITIAEIYTMGFFLTGVGEIGSGGDSNRVEFQTGMTNGIQVVKDYLKIDINVTFKNRMNYGTHVNYLLVPYFALSGKIPDTGISWGLSEEVEMLWNPENWKDTDPTYRTFDGNVWDETDGSRLIASNLGTFEYAKFSTKVTFDFEFFHFFAPENITGTLKLMNNFKVKLPYSYYLEISKEINDEFEVGFEVGLAGPKVYVALWGETSDFLNTAAPLNGDLGSYGSWDGAYIGHAKDYEEAEALDDAGLSLWFLDEVFDDSVMTSHPRPNLKIGPKINFSYSKEWFSFGTAWKGYETGIRRWDERGTNKELKWVNEFEIYAKFAL